MGGISSSCSYAPTLEFQDPVDWTTGSSSGESGLAAKSDPLVSRFWFVDKSVIFPPHLAHPVQS